MTTKGEKIYRRTKTFLFLVSICFVFQQSLIPSTSAAIGTTQKLWNTSRACLQYNSSNQVKVRHKSCLLRPDTGPCRGDIIQWYFDAKLDKCYRFFWGGCQGNGNKFETNTECMKYCYLKKGFQSSIPYFCGLAFDYGTCFGHYNRWYWDNFNKPRLYSGCGGNQNNFQSKEQCLNTCFRNPQTDMKTNNSNQTQVCIPVPQ